MINKTIVLIAVTVFLSLLAISTASATPFAPANEFQTLSEDETEKCEEGKCGEGKCGEGKCGDSTEEGKEESKCE